MPLDWSTAKIANREAVTLDADGNLSDMTTALIFATMPVGIGTITARNAEKFFARLDAYQRARGGLLRYSVEGPERWRVVNATLDTVRDHIGLSTNASTLTDAAFKRWLADYMMRPSVARAYSERAGE